MKFRKAAVKKNGNTDSVHVPTTLTEAVNLTLCKKPEGSEYHKIKCLNRDCNLCGVPKFQMLPEQLSDETDELVIWGHYAYVGTGKFLSNGQENKEDSVDYEADATMSSLQLLPGSS